MIYWVANIWQTKKIRCKTLMLRSDLFDYSNVYIAVKERIIVKSNDGNIRVNKANTS